MPSVDFLNSVAVARTVRVRQLEGMFDLPLAERSERRFVANLPVEDRPWSIGLIVGPSGCGKSSVARHAFGEPLALSWPSDKSIVDAFPDGMGIKDITGLLSSVGFSSPPSWLRPYGCLSVGEQFRATVARVLAESPTLAVVDEWTSTVDRTVAQIGSAAVAKAVRSRGSRLVAVGCHYDVIDWLQPDWTYEPHLDRFAWRELRRRPELRLDVVNVKRSAWDWFRVHHYLSKDLAAICKPFAAFLGGRPVAFVAAMSFAHPKSPGWREHRCVCLPDFQGVGIGNRVSEFLASAFAATGKPYRSRTGNPAMIAHRSRSSLWKMFSAPSQVKRNTGRSLGVIKGLARGDGAKKYAESSACGRLTAGFEYVGPANSEAARSLEVIA